jgi:hypothetical protein
MVAIWKVVVRHMTSARDRITEPEPARTRTLEPKPFKRKHHTSYVKTTASRNASPRATAAAGRRETHGCVSAPTDLGLLDVAALLHARELSAVELASAYCEWDRETQRWRTEP